jgi:hypothetical protein
VDSEPFWNHPHASWWERPKVAAITRAYEKALVQASTRRDEARDFSVDYDASYADHHWAPIMETLCG